MAAANQDFHDVKAYFLKGDGGSSLYDHVSDLFRVLIETRLSNPLATFEQLSSRLKQSKFEQKDILREVKEEKVRGVEWAERCNKSIEVASSEKIKKPKQPTTDSGSDSGSEEEPEPEPVEVPDFTFNAALLERCGVALCSQTELFMLHVSLKTLLHTQSDVRNPRFFGKILGSQKDYFILETELDFDDDEDADADTQASVEAPAEKKGEGANRFAYFVSNEAGGSWTRLPDVTPAQIRVARQITKFFTGNLDAPINSYPPFPGTEANYLRAQLARIAHSTKIAPSGFYVMKADKDPNQDDTIEPDPDPEAEEHLPKKMIENTEYTAPRVQDLVKAENWTHYAPFLLPQGRVQFWRPPRAEKKGSPTGEQGDGGDNEPGASGDGAGSEISEDSGPADDEHQVETGPALLTPAGEDDNVAELPAWTARRSTGLLPNPVVSLRSMRWPGAYSVASGATFFNVYVGFGQKFTNRNYTPPAPPLMQREPHTQRERFDPTIQQEAELEEKRNPKKPVVDDADDNRSSADPSAEQVSEDAEEEELDA